MSRALQTSAAPSRVEIRRVRTRMQLLRSAHVLMSTEGVDMTTIQAITAHADVGFGTFYNYFKSKEDIAARVLDCVINNLGVRNDAANSSAGIVDPVQVVANSVRLVAREMMSNRMWHWWVRRPDLLVERMRAGFESFGLRDMKNALETGRYSIINNDTRTAWSCLIWLLAGGIKDIVDGYGPSNSDKMIAAAVMRVMGVDREDVDSVVGKKLPPYPKIDIDFEFSLDEH